MTNLAGAIPEADKSAGERGNATSLLIPTSSVFLVVFAVLLYALCPNVYVGDSGLFQAASFSLGSAHPPGYPLFILTGKLASFLPLGNIAFRVNLVSALFTALTAVMVFVISVDLTSNKYASWSAALICSISPVLLPESLKAEVYTVNSFIAMLVFFCGLRLLKGANFTRFTLLGFFLVGLGMGNHHTTGFMGLVLLLPVCIRWKEMTVKWFFWGLLFFSLGLSVNLHLYFRSVAMNNSGGLLVYSYAGDFSHFKRILLRQDYKQSATINAVAGAFSFSNGWFYGFRNSLQFIGLSSTQPVLPFLLIGFVSLRKHKRVLAYFSFSVLVWFGLLGRMVWPTGQLSPKDVEVISVYFMPVIPVLYVAVGVGFNAVFVFFQKRRLEVLSRAMPLIFAIIPFVLLPYSLRISNLNSHYLSYDYTRDMHSGLPLKSLLMNYSDNPMFLSFYMRMVERYREDLLVMGTSGKNDVYGLESSPRWKYEKMYPDFYRNDRSTIREINQDFALREKLYVNNEMVMGKVFSRNYKYEHYLFSVALWPANISSDGFKDGVHERIKAAYEKTNYERLFELPLQQDFFAQELITAYSLNSMLYSEIMKKDVTSKEGDQFYLLPSESVISHDGHK